MNLIEELGGYKNAMRIINGDCDSNIDEKTLRVVLLKYCREHNLFHVNHKFVFTDPSAPNDVMTVSDGNDVEVYWDNDTKRIDIKDIRHATDAEIEMGKRLS
jgi:hypothetical protein